MPTYRFSNPKTGETKEIVLKMNEPHVYVDTNGQEWVREFTVPQASVDTTVNPESCRDFLNKTKNKRGTLGDMWDLSAELSEKRAKIHGKDPVKEKAKNAYSKKCHGKKHPLGD